MLNRLSDARERLLDAADLLIDFLTLGEYGLQPQPQPRPEPELSACRGQARRPTAGVAGRSRPIVLS